MSAHKLLPIFISGNEYKAKLLAEGLGLPLQRRTLQLDELQSLDLRVVAEHKARQAYANVQLPVLVEDVSLALDALHGLPGTYIKWFLERLSLFELSALPGNNRKATASVCYCFYDGVTPVFFEGVVTGVIADRPKGEGFGFNPIFIPEGYTKTYAEMSTEEILEHGLRTSTVYPQMRKFFAGS